MRSVASPIFPDMKECGVVVTFSEPSSLSKLLLIGLMEKMLMGKLLMEKLLSIESSSSSSKWGRKVKICEFHFSIYFLAAFIRPFLLDS